MRAGRAPALLLRLLLTTTLAVVGPVLVGAPAQAATIGLPYELSIQGGYGDAEVVLPIPEGTSPTRLTGSISSTYSAPGSLVVLINGHRAATVPAQTGGEFRIPLSGRDVVEGTLTITLRADLDPDEDCWLDDRAVAALTDARVRLDTAPPAPTTIAGFLSPAVTAFTVVVPATPTAAEQEAGLDAVLALAHRYGGSATITLDATDQISAGPGDGRLVLVEESDGDGNDIEVRGGRLLISGSADELPLAAVSLADPNLGVLAATSVSDLTGRADYRPLTGAASLHDLGIDALSVRGIGRVAQTVSVAQAAFGQPVEQLVLDLSGTATPVVPGQQGRVSIRWNDRLVSSRALTEDSRQSWRFTVGPDDLRSVNYLTAELEYLPASGRCSDPGLPGQVQIDVGASQVTPTFGQGSANGFQRFPQAFGAVVPVAIAGPGRPSLAHAAQVLAGVVAPSPLQYTVEMVQVPALAERGGVATGVDPGQVASLGAPLPDQGPPPGTTAPYAALQAFPNGDADIIVLSAEPQSQAESLATWPLRQDGGWAGLTGQVYVMGADSDQPEPVAAVTAAPDKRTPQFVAAAIITAVLLVALILWLRHRPARK